MVGVQPFGGHGLSGTGPKAGGPLYLHRLCRTDKAPELHGEPVPVAFDALRALEQALPDLPDLPPEQARRLRTRIRRYRADSPLNVKLPLPGPTGEDNSLWFEPRGMAACLAPALQPLLEQLAAAFATHNHALVPDDDLGRRLVRTIAHPAIAFSMDPATADIDALLFAGPPDRRQPPPHPRRPRRRHRAPDPGPPRRQLRPDPAGGGEGGEHQHDRGRREREPDEPGGGVGRLR